MDDKLYYVESPDEQVLGPMTMMHVLEGVAAGVILESARICEVGAQEWVYLSDVTYTRDGESDPNEAVAPAEQFLGAEEEPEAAADAWNDSGIIHGSVWPSGPEPPREPEPQEEPAYAAEPPAEPVPVPETEEEELVLASAPAEPERLAESEHFEAPFDEEPHESSASPEDPFEEPDLAEAEQAYSKRKGGRRWLVPVLATLALPVIAGAWVLSGRSIPYLGQAISWVDAFRPTSAPAETPAAPEIPPLQQARELLVAGQAGEALQRYDRILAEEPDNAAALHGRGLAALDTGDAPGAVESLEKACALDSTKAVWTADLAQAFHAAGQLDAALQRMDAYLAVQPEDRDRQLARLDWLLDAGRGDQAAETYTGLATEHPVNAYDQYLAGLALGEDPSAETYLSRSVELDPANADAHAALARLLAAKGDAAAAKESLEHAFEHREPTADEEALLASLDKTLAEEAAKAAPAPAAKPAPTVAAAKPEPKKPAPAPKVASAPAPKDEPKKAAPKKSEPKPAATFADYAPRIREQLAAEQFDRARSVLAEARKAVGTGRDARNNAGLWDAIIAFEEGDFDGALERFDKLDRSASYRASGFGDGAVANWTARVWFAKGDVRRAVAALEGVGPADPDEYATARLWEGIALASLGMDDLAARTWERIPEDVGSRVHDTGRGAVKSAQLLAGDISEKDYRTAVAPLPGFGNDMYFFLAYAAKRKSDMEGERENLGKAIAESKGREFPYYLARAQINGEGILGK